MVASSEHTVDVHEPHSAKTPARSAGLRVQFLAIGALACAALVAAPFLVGSSNKEIALEQKASFSKLSGDLLGGLEQAMDSSVDSRVKAFIAAPRAAGSIPVTQMTGHHNLLPFDPHPYVTQTQLDRLLAEKRELERKREAILRTLRIRRQAAAAKAAKDAAALDKIRLERAVVAAKKKQLESAQRAARAAAHEMQEAAVAKQQAMHAASVAAARQRELNYMSTVNKEHADAAAQADTAQNAADDMQYQQDKSAVDSKLAHYLAQEKDLLRKIAAAEKVAQHGGKWPAEGMPLSAPPAAAAASHPQQLSAAGERRKGVEQTVMTTLAGAMQRNERQEEADERAAQQLHSKYSALTSRVQSLQSADERLKREMVDAELKRVSN
eukprot:CAMPEP_0181347206 /NCGR_PEP_ID=MMETSP1101-20121128/33756_1 /TAXON_ID=46948 /ORGANISM="Rhodomonas abbreviata, Strain Caron Lab Isolate" /LENGTH=381 /DNA_ID=CAMNT_0023459407 /DNA_START=58 /DNA_END=1203 /DNA_ORIENTATION=-